jgi:hypothetical protein
VTSDRGMILRWLKRVWALFFDLSLPERQPEEE